MLEVEIIIEFEDVLNKLADLHIRFLQVIRDHKMRHSFSFVCKKIPKMNNIDEDDSTSLVEESVLYHNLSMQISKTVRSINLQPTILCI